MHISRVIREITYNFTFQPLPCLPRLEAFCNTVKGSWVRWLLRDMLGYIVCVCDTEANRRGTSPMQSLITGKDCLPLLASGSVAQTCTVWIGGPFTWSWRHDTCDTKPKDSVSWKKKNLVGVPVAEDNTLILVEPFNSSVLCTVEGKLLGGALFSAWADLSYHPARLRWALTRALQITLGWKSWWKIRL